MAEPSIQTVAQLIEHWRADALNFLRVDAPKLLIIVVVTFGLIRLLKSVTRRLRSLGEAKGLPTGVRAQQIRTLSGVLYSTGVFALVFLALLQILPVLGINMGPLLASAGIAGLDVLDEEIARRKLEAMGMDIDTMSKAQAEYARSWKAGT